MPIERQDNSVKSAVSQVVGSDSASENGAKTLAGSAIEGTWNLVAGKAANQKDRAERAHRADEYAELAADTVACLPKFKTVTGALARGVLLADVSGQKSLGQWTANFASNMAEGALLNRAGKLASPEGGLSKVLTSKFSSPLASELAMHGATGAAFGAVKAGFNISAARDESGQFSTSRYLENFALSTATGAVIGVPAGAFGSRVGRVVSERLGVGATGLPSEVNQSLLHQSIRHAAVGAAGGFAGGAVFGGVDSLRESKSFTDVLSGTLKGGTIGLITGAAAGGFEPGRSAASGGRRIGELPVPVPADARLAVAAVDISGEMGAMRRLHEVGSPGKSALIDDISSLSFRGRDLLDVRLSELNGSVKLTGTENRLFYEVNPELTADYDKFKAYAEKRKAEKGSYEFGDFFALSKEVNREVNVYESTHHDGKVFIPVEYDQQLNQVRNLRKLSEMHTPFHDLPAEVRMKLSADINNGDASVLGAYLTPTQIRDTIPFLQALKGLREHPLGNRILPEDMLNLMASAPSPNLVREVVLYDRRDYKDPFSAYEHDMPGFRAAADARPGGVVHFYEGKRESSSAETFFHEWSHLAKWNSPEISRFFDMATVLDKRGLQTDFAASKLAQADNPDHPFVFKEGIFFPREYASVSQDENWAVSFGDHILHGDADELYRYSQDAPVRALVLSTALETHLQQNPRLYSDPILENFKQRVQYLDTMARPLATQVLTERLTSGTTEERFMAARLLGFYGAPEAREALIRAGTDAANNVLPGKVSLAESGIRANHDFEPSNPRKPMTVAQTALEAAYRLSGRTETQRERTMVEEAINSPALRAAMIESWFELPMRNQGYRQLLETFDKPGAPLALQKLIEGRFLDDNFGRELAFKELIRQTAGDRELQVGYLLRNLEYVPKLRREAIDRLIGVSRDSDLSSRVSNKILDFLADRNIRTGVHELDRGLNEVRDNLLLQKKFDRTMKELARSNSPEEAVSHIRELGSLHDMRTITPLVKAAISGNESVQTEAMAALLQFPGTIVNFYAKGIRGEYQGNAAMNKRLDDFMARRGFYSQSNISIASIFGGELEAAQ